jgi:hypothetical protein
VFVNKRHVANALGIASVGLAIALGVYGLRPDAGGWLPTASIVRLLARDCFPGRFCSWILWVQIMVHRMPRAAD